jgi:hypothetical protein
MLILFWLITAFLCLVALGFIISILPIGRSSIFIVVIFLGLSYGLYGQWGSSRYLKQYYSQTERNIRQKQLELRMLLTEFRKTEFRLRVRLEENPKDQDAAQHLVELLKIKALLKNPES